MSHGCRDWLRFPPPLRTKSYYCLFLPPRAVTAVCSRRTGSIVAAGGYRHLRHGRPSQVPIPPRHVPTHRRRGVPCLLPLLRLCCWRVRGAVWRKLGPTSRPNSPARRAPHSPLRSTHLWRQQGPRRHYWRHRVTSSETPPLLGFARRRWLAPRSARGRLLEELNPRSAPFGACWPHATLRRLLPPG